jgi:integrase
MKRRGHGEGSIVQRSDGRWWGAFPVPGDKRRYYSGATRQEVAKKRREVQKTKDAGLPVVREKQTFGQFLGDWLEAKRPALEPGSYVEYEGAIRKHLVPALGKVPLAKLSPQHLERFYDHLIGIGLSSSTIRKIQHGVVHPALDRASRFNLVARNVAALIDLPKREKRHESRVLTVEEVWALHRAVSGHRLEALYVLELSTGMRLGELLGLRWRDVDLARGAVSVSQNYKRDYSGRFMGKPKSDRGIRHIPLAEPAVRALRAHRERQGNEMEKAGLA